MTQEQENVKFEQMLKYYGAIKLEQMIQRREPARKYYRAYPYDGWSSRVGVEYIDLVHPSDPLSEIIADEGRQEMLAALTEHEREIVLLSETGLYPREIAAQKGRKTSNAVRFSKFSARQKVARLRPAQAHRLRPDRYPNPKQRPSDDPNRSPNQPRPH